jgi:Ca2+-binding RTX toxin-like protein
VRHAILTNNDTVYGGDGNDTLFGDRGRDKLYGEDGDNTFFTRDGRRDTLRGGTSFDTATADTVGSVIDLISEVEENL